MIVLGIESTAHTFGVGIVNEKEILANEKTAYTTQEGGMIPTKVADHHINICDTILEKALETAGIGIYDVDVIAFSQSPGIGHSLRVGAIFARSLSLLLKKPLVGVNHCIAHLEIGRFATDAQDPVLLYASGANTQIIAYEAGRYRIFGETLDIGVGNFLDSFARELGLGFPGGPKIEKLAQEGKAQGYELIDLPYSVKGMDVSFGGILTKLKQLIQSGEYTNEQLCYSVQETVFAMLIEISERAMAHCDKKELLLGGGVACNKHLQDMCTQMCEDRGAKSYAPSIPLLVDNAAMIAWTGLRMYKQGRTILPKDACIKPYERTDEVEITL